MRIADVGPDALVVLKTAFSTVESAVGAIKGRAYHYVKKPFDMDEMLLLVERALETTGLRREVRRAGALAARPGWNDPRQPDPGGAAARPYRDQIRVEKSSLDVPRAPGDD